MGVMWDRAATVFFWQLVSNVPETDISHVSDNVIKKTPTPDPPASFTDWQAVLSVTNMAQMHVNFVKSGQISVYRLPIFFPLKYECNRQLQQQHWSQLTLERSSLGFTINYSRPKLLFIYIYCIEFIKLMTSCFKYWSDALQKLSHYHVRYSIMYDISCTALQNIA